MKARKQFKLLSGRKMMRIEQSEVRKSLEMMGDNVEDGIGGVVVIERRDRGKDRMNGLNCVTFCLGKGTFPFARQHDCWLTTKGYHEVQNPEKNDLVVYINQEDEKTKIQAHIGRYEGNGLIISKWGYGPIVQHPLASVPNSFGDEVRFFRKD